MLKLKAWANWLNQSHDRVDFPDGKAPIVIAAVGARVPAGVINVVKGSSTWPEVRGQRSDVREAKQKVQG